MNACSMPHIFAVALRLLTTYYIPICGGNGGYGPPTALPTDQEGNLENLTALRFTCSALESQGL